MKGERPWQRNGTVEASYGISRDRLGRSTRVRRRYGRSGVTKGSHNEDGISRIERSNTTEV